MKIVCQSVMPSDVQDKTRACHIRYGGPVFVITLHKLCNYFLNLSKCSGTYLWDLSPPLSLVDAVNLLDLTFRLQYVCSST